MNSTNLGTGNEESLSPPQAHPKLVHEDQTSANLGVSESHDETLNSTSKRRGRGHRTDPAVRWHHTLHPNVRHELARNALPKHMGRFVHPTHAVLVHVGASPDAPVAAASPTGVYDQSISAHGPDTSSGQAARMHEQGRREQKWTSRNERKHRFVAVAPTTPTTRLSRRKEAMEKQKASQDEVQKEGEKDHRKTLSRHPSNALIGIWHMLVRIEYWNWFTWGSIVWVINGFAAFLPYGDSAHYQPADYSVGWTAFLGATIFEFGAIFAMWEAWNREDVAGFGWSVKEVLESVKEDTAKSGERVLSDVEAQFPMGQGEESQVESPKPGVGIQTTERAVKRKPVPDIDIALVDDTRQNPSYPSDTDLPASNEHENAQHIAAHHSPLSVETRTAPTYATKEKHQGAEKVFTESVDSSSLTFTGSLPSHLRKKWIWFTLDVKYFREIGFWAAFTQFWAATIFWISGFTAIPTIQFELQKHPAALNGAFWSPQVVGGSGFIISSTFIMLETQTRWWKPNLTSIGWHVGFWNFVGGVGFTLCGALGYAAASSHGAAYQSSLSTFWGGWAFLIGSVLQWYESVNSVEQES